MPRRQAVLTLIVLLAGCASAGGNAGPGLRDDARLLVTNPTQYLVKVYASRTAGGHGARMGELAIGARAAYRLPYTGDVYFRLERLNGRAVWARAHVMPGDRVELEPNPAWSMVFVTIHSGP